MSLRSKRELIRVNYERYQEAKRLEKGRILDEFVIATGYNRKYAMEVLNHPPRLKAVTGCRKRRRRYGVMVREALVSLWKIANCICGKRLVALLPGLIDALERHHELALEPPSRSLLLQLSASTIDRMLQSERRSLPGRGKSTTKPGTLLRRQIPVRTFADWNEKHPGFMEVDLVAHCDDDSGAEYLHTLTLTDIYTGWTELQALANKGQQCACRAIHRASQQLPFPMRGLDSDNGSEFINHHLLRYCNDHQVTFTRCRPYRKNDQCHVEQKNWSIVRRMVGHDRYEGGEALKALDELYRVLTVYENFFQPCMKLLSKERRKSERGERTVKHYDTPKTPYQRVMECETLTPEVKDALREQYEQLNPKSLLEEVHRRQKRLWDLAARRWQTQAE